ncbi:TPA: glycosyltransferase [Streptococcus suis]
MEENYPEYSILMSVYYKEKPEFLKISINSMLEQSVRPSEFIIVKDGPLPNNLNRILDSFKKRFPNLFKFIELEKNVGLGPALRIGVEQCKYEWIVRMDSDDYSVPDRVEKQFKVINENPDISLVGSNVYEFIDRIDNVICLVDLPEVHDQIYNFSKTRCPFRHPSLMYKKSSILRSGNYREYYLMEDYDLYVRFLREGFKCYNIQEPLVYMRISDDFFKRRGGWKYLKSILKFKNEQLLNGYFTPFQYLKSTVPHIVVSILPNNLRDWIYKNTLRKKVR